MIAAICVLVIIFSLSAPRLYHISEDSNIKSFIPRPSPSVFENIQGDVVFAITERFLCNYLFPRNCPRVTFYANEHTTDADKEKFLGGFNDFHFLITEERWLKRMQQAKLYCYEFSTKDFVLLDSCAGYYISYNIVDPIDVTCIENPYNIIMQQENCKLLFLPEIKALAEEVKKSSLSFSLIRMRFAI